MAGQPARACRLSALRLALFAPSRLRIDSRYQHVLVRGGLRGAFALVLALPANIPERGEIIAAAFAVVAFSIFAQGLTMPWLIRHLRLSASFLAHNRKIDDRVV